jgi:hypothetical protein
MYIFTCKNSMFGVTRARSRPFLYYLIWIRYILNFNNSIIMTQISTIHSFPLYSHFVVCFHVYSIVSDASLGLILHSCFSLALLLDHHTFSIALSFESLPITTIHLHELRSLIILV